ncbi:uncharacterized protein LOC8283830 isoform X2 [Ricinus communis]|uniref:uncharacterized protein LOC8283830 isoform X2 n=1 Tax=Ricinus communis TaxID=3988 RepID=UPI00201AF6D8|nr:uncharacterized protein LOC8283830 isoform X2 [Ricinus communis]
MSDRGDKVCPLCTEEMDLTDQQLKPCKCGYEICVWCWNQIMEMAEKEKTEGRCPACRSAYDKERIVGMAANCERLVAEINSERKLKSQKAKPKPSEGRMHLSNVRVIQRNLVYIIGLPLNLADEALLPRREYFGQYGKVLKASISKTSTGVIQHSSNNSCCVYITYSKEEEAVRCIQSVHSFILEGRSLRACFGTTKYCHSWLKNQPCSIPDCLYLHEFGTQEDSFTKDDLVSAFTRVQQNIGATINLHRRSGNMLPPPADEYTDGNISSTATPDCRGPVNTVGNSDGGSFADSDGGSFADNGTERSNALPGAASWVMCVSSSVPLATSMSVAAGTHSLKPETPSSNEALASEIGSPKGSSGAKNITIPEGSSEAQPSVVSCGGDVITSAGTNSLGLAKQSPPPAMNKEENFADGEFQGLCSAVSSISISSHPKDENTSSAIPISSVYTHSLPITRGSYQDVNLLIESSASPALRESSIVEDLPGFDKQLSDSGDAYNLQLRSCLLSSKQNLKPLGHHPGQQGESNHHSPVDSHQSTVPIKCDGVAYQLRSGLPVLSNGSCGNQPSGHFELDRASNYSSILSDVGSAKYLEGCDDTKVSSNNKAFLDIGESSIISSILSMDLDAWEDTLTSPKSFVKLLTETDKQHGTLKVPSLRKVQDSNQSRFSFARQDDFLDQDCNMGHPLANAINSSSASHHYNENKYLSMDKYNDISSNGSSVESNSFLSSHTFPGSNYSVAKAPTSPPGFSVSSRAVPPGFPTNRPMNYDANFMLQNSAPSSRKVGSYADVEFFDPAIMEVGDGLLAARLNSSSFDMRPAMSSRFSPFDHDTELQLLMQQPISAKQNHRFPDHFRSRVSPPNDAYNISSMLMGQSPPSNPSPFAQVTAQQVRNVHMSNGCWSGWDETKSVNNVGMPELLVNGRLGFNKIIPSHEDLKYHISSSSKLYNRGFAL